MAPYSLTKIEIYPSLLLLELKSWIKKIIRSLVSNKKGLAQKELQLINTREEYQVPIENSAY